MYAYKHNNEPWYTPQPFARFGIGVLTGVIVCAALGLYFLIFGQVTKTMAGGGVLCLIAGLLVYAALEFFVQGRRHRLSGVDDVLLYATLGCMMSGVCALDDLRDPALLWALGGVLCAAAVLRFADRFVAVVCLACFLEALLYSADNHTSAVRVLAASVLAVLVNGMAYRKEAAPIAPTSGPYGSCLYVLRYASLLALYGCLNYYFLDKTGTAASQWYFWIPTFILPLVYILLGLLRRARPALHVGLATAVLAVITYREYHTLLPLAEAMTLAGAILIGLSWGLIRYLRTPRSGFASEATGDALLGDAELFAVTQVFGAKTTAPHDDRSFGGGSFGGGGAGGDF